MTSVEVPGLEPGRLGFTVPPLTMTPPANGESPKAIPGFVSRGGRCRRIACPLRLFNYGHCTMGCNTNARTVCAGYDCKTPMGATSEGPAILPGLHLRYPGALPLVVPRASASPRAPSTALLLQSHDKVSDAEVKARVDFASGNPSLSNTKRNTPLAGPGNSGLFQQIGIDPVLRRRPAGAGTPVDGPQPHDSHQSLHPLPAYRQALPVQRSLHPPGTVERGFQVLAVHGLHQGQVPRGCLLGTVVEAGAADAINWHCRTMDRCRCRRSVSSRRCAGVMDRTFPPRNPAPP